MTAVYFVMGAFWFVLGVCVFSFLEVVAARLPAGRPIVKGRSQCDACGHVLTAGELIPVVSYALGRGRCRQCGARLSLWYPFSEAVGGALCIACGLRFGVGPVFGLSARAALWFAVLCLLWTESRIDMATMELPDVFQLLLLAAGVAAVFLCPEISLKARLIGAVCVSVPMLILAFFTGGFGGGDIKLTAATGFLLGWKNQLTAFAFAVFFGGLYGIWLLAVRKAGGKTAFAFGPYLALGAALALFVGDAVREWYLGLLWR